MKSTIPNRNTYLAAIVLAFSSMAGCAVQPAANRNSLDIDNVNQCRDICSSVDMELGAVVVVMNSTGCVCEVAKRSENAGASTVAGAGVVHAVLEQQKAQAKKPH
jgi:hypothetical protein